MPEATSCAKRFLLLRLRQRRYVSFVMAKGRFKFDTKAREVFLNRYEQTGLKHLSARAAGVCPQTVNEHINEDEDFAMLAANALQAYRESVEQEVMRRGIEGWDEPIHYQGKPTSVVRKYSDRLLELHAKRHIPEYREKPTLDVNLQGGVLVVPGSGANSAEWEKALSEKKEDDPSVK